MGDDFEKKLDMIFERITAILETKHEKKLDIMLRRINAITTSAAAFAALIISISSLNINFNTYNLTKEQVSLNTTENLALSVENGNVDIVDLKQGEAEPELYYRAELSVCIINKSNLPISVVSGNISRADSDNYAQIFPNVYELDYPISMQPQETKNLDFYMLVKIPDFINELIEKFPEPSEVDFSTITKYLFFEKYTDLVGNKVIVKEKGGTTKFIMHLTLPFTLQLDTAKGNVFSTQFYEGGPEFFLDKEYEEKMTEQYGSWSLEFSTEPIADNSSKNHMSFWQFLKDNPSTILIIVIPIALWAFFNFIYYANLYIWGKHQKQKQATPMTQNKQVNLHTEHDDLLTEDETNQDK